MSLSPSTVLCLRRHRRQQLEERVRLGAAYQDDGLVPADALGCSIDPSTLRRSWLLIVREAGLEHVRFHDLRHAHATLMALQGTHPKIVSERLGHSGIRITLDTYSHVLQGLQAQAAASLDAIVGV